MTHGAVIGIVEDNQDPEGMHRVKVRLPVDSEIRTRWCRVVTPMAGTARGLVILPEVGTEVLVTYTYQSHHPIVMGALYNGEDDPPEPYRNDDEENNRRVFWSRNGNMVDFDDTEGEEKVGIGSLVPTRLKVSSAPVYNEFESAEKRTRQYSEGSIFYEAKGQFSIKCASFSLRADMVQIKSGSETKLSGKEVQIECGGTVRASSPDTHVKTPASPPCGQPACGASPAKHLPKVA